MAQATGGASGTSNISNTTDMAGQQGTQAPGTTLLELDQHAWKGFLDSVERWLGNVLMAQSAFRHLADDTIPKIADPRVQEQLIHVRDVARQHEQEIDDLYRIIGRDPAKARGLLGTTMGKLREGLAVMLGTLGGVEGGWSDLHQLLLANLNAMGAYGAVEQLGLALGLQDLVTRAFEVVRVKSTHQLLLQEYLLELAPVAILYSGLQASNSPQPILQGAARASQQTGYPGTWPADEQPLVTPVGAPRDPIQGNESATGAAQSAGAHAAHGTTDTTQGGSTTAQPPL